jgi:hypothetical protein
MYCEYYQAKVLKEKTWFLSASIRNERNVAFARAITGKTDTFEFFVPKDQEKIFLHLIEALKKRGIIISVEKKPNRFKSFSSDA